MPERFQDHTRASGTTVSLEFQVLSRWPFLLGLKALDKEIQHFASNDKDLLGTITQSKVSTLPLTLSLTLSLSEVRTRFAPMGACLSRRTHAHDSKQAESEPASAAGELPAQQPEQQQEEPLLEQQGAESPVAKIYIIFYSVYGHVEALARRVKAGVDSVEGAEGVLYRVPETLPLDKVQAPATRDESIPVIDVWQLPSADGFLFGFPTRYGAMAAQMKAFFDSTGKLWSSQQLAGKPAGLFVSTGTQGGGQETTAWTAITQLAHHGMLYVPLGYTFGAGMFSLDELRGGSPYGAGTYAGQGSRQPSEAELQLAEHQGSYTAGIVKRLIGAS